MSGAVHFEIYPQTRHGAEGEDGRGRRERPTGEFGWRFKAANGEIMAASGEGFTRREDANRAIHDLLAAIHAAGDPHPPILDVEG